MEDRVKCTLLSRAETEKRGRLWRSSNGFSRPVLAVRISLHHHSIHPGDLRALF